MGREEAETGGSLGPADHRVAPGPERQPQGNKTESNKGGHHCASLASAWAHIIHTQAII